MFEKLTWQSDRMILNDLVFRLEHFRSDSWNGGDHFRFYKVKPLVDQYADFFSHWSQFHPSRLFELGIWDGGSTAFWYEMLRPKHIVAVDIEKRSDSPYFEKFVSSRGLKDHIKTFWEFDQADKDRLRALAAQEFGGQLDMVIDDAAHLYAPARASFETLFPLCVPGALYFIEDWAWDHWPEFSKPNHPWFSQQRLTDLIIELVEAAGTSRELISSLSVYEGFVVVERGPAVLKDPSNFKLDDHIRRRPVPLSRNSLKRMWKSITHNGNTPKG